MDLFNFIRFNCDKSHKSKFLSQYQKTFNRGFYSRLKNRNLYNKPCELEFLTKIIPSSCFEKNKLFVITLNDLEYTLTIRSSYDYTLEPV
jgi:hypothetical protein